MEQQIKEHISCWRFRYILIPNDYIENIHNLLFRDIIQEVQNGVVMLYYGAYYKTKGDYDRMIAYYMQAIQLGNTVAMNNLASHYDSTIEHFRAMEYRLLAIEHGNFDSLDSVVWQYVLRREHSNVVKYCLMGIQHGHAKSMHQLAAHYGRVQDYTNAKKYHLMAIECGETGAMHDLAYIYKRSHDYEQAMKYWSQMVDHGNYTSCRTVLTMCMKKNLITLGTNYINKILNKVASTDIVSFILHFINVMDADMVNIVINMRYDDYWYGAFRELVDI